MRGWSSTSYFLPVGVCACACAYVCVCIRCICIHVRTNNAMIVCDGVREQCIQWSPSVVDTLGDLVKCPV